MHLPAPAILPLLTLTLFLFPSPSLPTPTPWDGHTGHTPRPSCLTLPAATQLVSIFESFFVTLDPSLATRYLTPTFSEYSDSINNITQGADRTPGSPTATSRSEFIAQQLKLQKSPQPNFTTLAVYHGCDSVTFRWRLNLPLPVSGIDVLVVERGTHLIERDYSEFNTVGLLANGGYCLGQ